MGIGGGPVNGNPNASQFSPRRKAIDRTHVANPGSAGTQARVPDMFSSLTARAVSPRGRGPVSWLSRRYSFSR